MAAMAEKRKVDPYANTYEYFFINSRSIGHLTGYLGRLGYGDPYFHVPDMGLAYFKRYAQREPVYLSFNRIDIYKIIDMAPGKPMLFTLQKLNGSVMPTEDKNESGTHIHITAGDRSVITTGDHNTVHVNYTHLQGNPAQLRQELEKQKVPMADIEEIVGLVQQERPGADGKLPGQVSGWLAKMYQKSLDGAWEIGLLVAGGVLVEIIKAYYGIH
jgi:hypothetical protein